MRIYAKKQPRMLLAETQLNNTSNKNGYPSSQKHRAEINSTIYNGNIRLCIYSLYIYIHIAARECAKQEYTKFGNSFKGKKQHEVKLSNAQQQLTSVDDGTLQTAIYAL